MSPHSFAEGSPSLSWGPSLTPDATVSPAGGNFSPFSSPWFTRENFPRTLQKASPRSYCPALDHVTTSTPTASKGKKNCQITSTLWSWTPKLRGVPVLEHRMKASCPQRGDRKEFLGTPAGGKAGEPPPPHTRETETRIPGGKSPT